MSKKRKELSVRRESRAVPTTQISDYPRSTPIKTRNAMILLLSVLALACLNTKARAAIVTWTGGAGNGEWESGGNWTGGVVPTQNDDVVIPPDSGGITTNGNKKEVKSLDVKDSKKPSGTTISPDDSGKDTKFEAEGDITIGKGNTVRGSNGNNGQSGGDVEITSTAGKITNKGTIKGGDGGMGKSPKNGGDVKIQGKDIENTGIEQGGRGGDKTKGKKGKRKGKGKNGGNVTNTAQKTCKPGKKVGGEAGTGPSGDGKKGGVTATAEEFLALFSGDFQSGGVVSLQVGSGGTILMAGLSAGAIQADTSVFIDGGSAETTIDMTGNLGGIDIIVAGSNICVFGDVILDPGVSLASITEPDGDDSSVPCRSIPTVSEWSVANGGNGHYYAVRRLTGSDNSWHAARLAAGASMFGDASGYLATITSQAENDFVVNLIQSQFPQSLSGSVKVWLGGYQQVPTGSPNAGWVWVTGEPWLYTNWLPGEANDYMSMPEDFLGMWIVDDPKLHSYWNDFINSPDPNSPGMFVVEW